jgi:hypothetical protein
MKKQQINEIGNIILKKNMKIKKNLNIKIIKLKKV